jgi:4-amino-4-deoxy-L-arabinose transferase-like glycosyltransferase
MPDNNTTLKQYLDTLLDSKPAFFLFISLYCGVFILLRVLLPNSLELDEAEQVYFAQWWQWGYGAQPPLYTWIQTVFFAVFGYSVWALTLLKHALLFGIHALVYLLTAEITGNRKLAFLASLSLLVFPQLTWYAHLDLTHSILLIFTIISIVYLSWRAWLKTDVWVYIGLGLAIAAGMLAKYNFVIFLLAWLLTLGSMAETRRLLFHKYALVSIVITIICVLPHLLWWLDNHQASSEHAIKHIGLASDSFTVWQGFGELLEAALLSVTPLWLLAPIFFRQALKPIKTPSIWLTVFAHYFIIVGLCLLILNVFATGMEFKERWVVPYTFLVAPYLFMRLAANAAQTELQIWRPRVYVIFCLSLASVVAFGLTARVIWPDKIGDVSKINYPYSALKTEIAPLLAQGDIIVTPTKLTAGNLKLHLPQYSTYSFNNELDKVLALSPAAHTLLVWKQDLKCDPGDKFEYLPSIQPVKYTSLYLYSREQVMSFYYARLSPDAWRELKQHLLSLRLCLIKD